MGISNCFNSPDQLDAQNGKIFRITKRIFFFYYNEGLNNNALFLIFYRDKEDSWRPVATYHLQWVSSCKSYTLDTFYGWHL